MNTVEIEKGILGLAISLAMLAVAVGSASAGCVGIDTGTDYGCGDTVVESCIFNKNLVCPAGVHGLEVGESGITIDGYNATLCRHFKITGSENAAACEWCDEVYPEGGDCGILNLGGYDNVEIKNLEIENFCNGIVLKGSGPNPVVNNTIDNCKVHDNGNETKGYTYGIYLAGFAQHCTVNNNAVYNNTGEVTTACDTGGHGIKLYQMSNYNNITNNEVYKNSVAGIYSKKKCMYNYAAYNEVYENGKIVGGPAEIGCVAEDGTVYKCGDMVVQSCTFNGDMSCPSGHGLVVGTDDITIEGYNPSDNAYYAITGDKTSGTYGIYNYNSAQGYGYNNVCINNLTISSFTNGIYIKGKMGEDPPYPGLHKVEHNTIYNCTVHDNGDGFGINFKSCVCNSTITECEVYNTTGTLYGTCEDAGSGIRLHSKCDHNNVTNNVIHHNGLAGIYSKMICLHNYIAYNDVYENGVENPGETFFGGGIRFQCKKSNFETIENNNVTDNFGPGIYIGGNGCIVRNNTVTGNKDANSTQPNGRGDGLRNDRYADSGGFRTEVYDNTFCDNEHRDINVESTAQGVTGDDNTCDTTYNYNDDGTTGCTYPCALSGISENVNEDKINMAGVMTWWYDYTFSFLQKENLC